MAWTASSLSTAAEPYGVYTELYGCLSALESTVPRTPAQARVELQKKFPGIEERLQVARALSQKRWGLSANFDELAKSEILPVSVLRALEIPHTVRAGGLIVTSAGMMHTYGYLFSQLQTQYGKKGKRWIESRLDERLGLPAASFSPKPPKGEFLTLLTQTLDDLAKRSDVLEERIEVSATGSKPASWHVLTYLTPLRSLPEFSSSDTWLLSYGFKRGLDQPITWITAFPVSEAKAHEVQTCTAEFAPHYNWVLPESLSVVRSSCEFRKITSGQTARSQSNATRLPARKSDHRQP